MRKSRTIITLMLSLILVMAMGTSVFAASSLTQKEAVAKAIRDSGVKQANVSRLDAELDEGKYEIGFRSKASGTKFDYEISKKSGKILEKSVDYAYKHNASKSKVGKAEARKAAAKKAGVKYSAVKDCKCTYEYDKKKKEGTYEVKFKNSSYRYEIEVLAPTGKVIELEKEYVKK